MTGDNALAIGRAIRSSACDDSKWNSVRSMNRRKQRAKQSPAPEIHGSGPRTGGNGLDPGGGRAEPRTHTERQRRDGRHLHHGNRLRLHRQMGRPVLQQRGGGYRPPGLRRRRLRRRHRERRRELHRHVRRVPAAVTRGPIASVRNGRRAAARLPFFFAPTIMTTMRRICALAVAVPVHAPAVAAGFLPAPRYRIAPDRLQGGPVPLHLRRRLPGGSDPDPARLDFQPGLYPARLQPAARAGERSAQIQCTVAPL